MSVEERMNDEVGSMKGAENRPTSRYDRKTYYHPIPFWDDFDEVELLVRQVTCKQLRKMNFSRTVVAPVFAVPFLELL